MGKNTDTLKAGWDAFSRGDVDALKEGWDEDIEWENPEFEKSLRPGVTRGKEAIVQMFGEVLGEFENVEMTPGCLPARRIHRRGPRAFQRHRPSQPGKLSI